VTELFEPAAKVELMGIAVLDDPAESAVRPAPAR